MKKDQKKKATSKRNKNKKTFEDVAAKPYEYFL